MHVELDGELLVESRRPLTLFESGLPTRCTCPRDLALSYPDPISEYPRIAGPIACSNER